MYPQLEPKDSEIEKISFKFRNPWNVTKSYSEDE